MFTCGSAGRLDFEAEGPVILARAPLSRSFQKSGVIRVKQYKQSLAIQSDGKKGSKGKRGHGLGCLPGPP